MKETVLMIASLALAACAATGDGGRAESTSTDAAFEREFKAFCASGPLPPCRQDVEFTLTLDEQGNDETFRFGLMPPPVQNDTINILPGETLYVSGSFIGSKLVLPRVTREEPAAESWLKFTFSQQAAKPDMLLHVKNTYPHPVKYRLVMMPPDREQLFKTSSCPVMPNMSSFEHWPHAIFQLVVLEMRAMQETAPECTW